MSGVLGVALVGAGYISRVYVEVFPRLLGARLVGVASRSRAAATRLADAYGASVAVDYGNLDELLRAASVDVVCVNSINRLHAQHAVGAARAGKHVIVEKPLCLTLAEADAMLEAARDAGAGFAYAENLCFAPHYRRARELIASGAVGDVLSARQCEKHGGPYSPWFWSAEEAGGGALLDLGCHGIECLRWLLDKPRVARVSARLATLRHGDRTQLEDDASVTLELEDGTRLVSESSWAARDGGESTLEVQGSEGTLEVDLLGASDLRLRRRGADWQRIPAGPAGDSGYLQELTHFLDCFRKGLTPEERGEDGRAVLEIVLAAYASAGRGAPVSLPFDPGDVARPIDLWLGQEGDF